MCSQDELETALNRFCKEFSMSVDLIVDGFSAQKKPPINRFCNQVGTILKILEGATPWGNRDEIYVGVLKEAVRKCMSE